MGRAIMIVTVGALLGLGSLLFSSLQTRNATDRVTGEYQYNVIARDVANSGVDRALSEAQRSLSDVRRTWTNVDVAGGSYDLDIKEVAYGDLVVHSQGTSGESEHSIESSFIFEAPIPAAVVLSGPTIKVGGTGNFEISGTDRRAPSKGTGNGFLKPAYGVMVSSGAQATAVQAAVDAKKLTGQGGTGSVMSGADVAFFEALYAEAVGHTGLIKAGAPFSSTYGNSNSPKLVHVIGDFKPAGPVSGAGLLIVEDGDFVVSNGFEWEGVVIVRKSTIPNVEISLGPKSQIYGSFAAYEAVSAVESPACVDVPFNISGLETIPEIAYRARFDVLGSAISYGGTYDMPVTAALHVGDDVVNAWGSFDDALDGNLNTGLVYDYEPTDALPAGTPLTISARSWSRLKGTDGSAPSDWRVYMEQNSASGGSQLVVLRDGDKVPSVLGFLDQVSIVDYVGDFLGLDGTVQLEENQAIYLFELGSTNLGSPAYDLQDLVVVVTLAAAEGECAAAPLATGELNINLDGAGLYYSGEAIGKLGKELASVRSQTKVVVASQRETTAQAESD